MEYVFRKLNVPALYADAVKTNAHSRKALEKAGFELLREDENFAYYLITRRD